MNPVRQPPILKNRSVYRTFDALVVLLVMLSSLEFVVGALAAPFLAQRVAPHLSEMTLGHVRIDETRVNIGFWAGGLGSIVVVAFGLLLSRGLLKPRLWAFVGTCILCSLLAILVFVLRDAMSAYVYAGCALYCGIRSPMVRREIAGQNTLP